METTSGVFQYCSQSSQYSPQSAIFGFLDVAFGHKILINHMLLFFKNYLYKAREKKDLNFNISKNYLTKIRDFEAFCSICFYVHSFFFYYYYQQYLFFLTLYLLYTAKTAIPLFSVLKTLQLSLSLMCCLGTTKQRLGNASVLDWALSLRFIFSYI